MEEIVGWLVEKIDVSARKIPRSFTKRIEVKKKQKNSTFTGNWMHLHRFLYGDKCKNIDVRDIINVQVHLLFFLAAGLFEDKARERAFSISVHFSATHCSV